MPVASDLQAAHSHALAPAAIPTPPADIYFGAYVNYPSNQSASQTATFEQDVYGNDTTHMALNMHYGGFDPSTWPWLQIQDDWNNGRVPVMSWNCGDSDANVANGNDDSTIKELLSSGDLGNGKPIMIRWFWEMNLQLGNNRDGNNPNGNNCEDTPGNTGPVNAANWIQAYKHIRSVLGSLTNVTWVWSPAASKDTNFTAMNTYYPGDSNVDWIGIDAYEKTATSFTDTFQNAYNDITHSMVIGGLGSNRPILVTETGATSANQAAFFSGAVSSLKTNFPRIAGLMYFDSDAADNWVVVGPNSTPQWLDFVAMIDDPYMSAKYSI